MGQTGQSHRPARHPQRRLDPRLRLGRFARPAQLFGHEIGVGGQSQADDDLDRALGQIIGDHGLGGGQAQAGGDGEKDGGQTEGEAEAFDDHVEASLLGAETASPAGEGLVESNPKVWAKPSRASSSTESLIR